MQITRETFKDNYKLLIPLFEDHWKEIGMFGATRDNLPLNLNIDYYLNLEANNQLLCIALKTDEGEIVGYLDYIIYEHYHHVGSNFAYTDCFMIKKDYRDLNGFKSILKMFKLAEEILRNEYGVKYIQMVFSCGNDLTRLASRMGYKNSDVLMLKTLGV